MFHGFLTVVVIAVIIGVIFSFWKYKKLESIVKNTRKDLDNCEFSINVINEQLNTFKDAVKKIDSQITTLEEKVNRSRSKKVKVSE